jgi:hypothetical protein
MVIDDRRQQRSSPKAVGARGSRQARLAAALKANLARRKAQARRRPPAPDRAAVPREDHD